MSEYITVEGMMLKDPELAFSAGGVAYSNLFIGTKQKDDESGQWVNGQSYSVTCFGQFAENAAESLLKYDRIIVEGKLEKTYENDEGETVTLKTPKIAANKVGISLRYNSVTIDRTEKFVPKKPRQDSTPVDYNESPF